MAFRARSVSAELRSLQCTHAATLLQDVRDDIRRHLESIFKDGGALSDALVDGEGGDAVGPGGDAVGLGNLCISPVPSGFRRNGLICVVARLANRPSYSLRRDV
jgi:hypothetical protein